MSTLETLRYVDLLSMSPSASTTFSSQIARTEGIVQVYIHPFCLDGTNFEKKSPFPAYKERRDAEIAEGNVVIFQESYPNNPLPTDRQKDSGNVLYVVNERPPIDDLWKNFIGVLKAAQVKKIQIGGAFSGLCVTNAAERLEAGGFSVARSLAQYPARLKLP